MSIPYFPLYPSDFEADTAHLTLAEDGAYNRLLRLCWRTSGCSIPDDRKWIMRKLRVSAEEYDAIIDPIIDEYFTRAMGRVSNARLCLEFAKISELKKSRSDAGKKGVVAKALKNNKKAPSKADLLLKQPEPEPEPEITPLKAPQNGGEFFDDFWDAYPDCKRKTDRPKAMAAFKAIVLGKKKGIPKTDPQKIISGIKAYAKSNPDPEFIPLPTTWLNGARWNDQAQVSKKYEAYR